MFQDGRIVEDGSHHTLMALDADHWGRQAADRIAEKFRAKGHDVTVLLPPKGKDWNEYLQLIQKAKTKER